MESFVIGWRELLVGAMVVLAVYIAELLLLMRSGKSRGLKVWERGAAANALARVETLEQELGQLRSQLQELQSKLEKSRQHVPLSTPYGQANQMAERGSDAAEIAQTCGISRGEADLIVALNKAREHEPK
ncbi:MAG: DUF2802 domain-containing protein [Burkholderiales bacterium]